MRNGSDHCMVDPVLGLDVNIGLTGGALSFDVCVALIGILSNRWRTAESSGGVLVILTVHLVGAHLG